jgi:capsular polysaccharide biosynthesis protein
MVRIIILRLLESYFRHRWLYLVPVVIALAAGGVFVAITPPSYSASGQLYVSQQNLLADLTSSNTGGSWWTSAAQATVTEINELIGTQAFIRSVIKKTDLEKQMADGPAAVDETITYARQILSIQPVGDKLVEISAKGEDPAIVYQIVVSTMDAYVQWKINSGYQESIAASTFFDNLIKPYQDEVDQTRSDLVTFLTDHPQPVRGDRPPEETMEMDRLQALVTQAEERLNSAKNNAESARLSQAKSESITKQTYMVIDQPQMPQDAKISTKAIATNLVIFLVVGIFLSVAGIVGGSLIDHSLRFPIDVRHGLSLPVLAMVPVAKPIILSLSAVEQPVLTPAAPAESVNSEEGAKGDPSILRPRAS